jgi:MoaA/NifB/PqqE/SkfB family radical SAM enzyme
VAAKQQVIDLESLNRTIGEAKLAGNSFFGILGGEPFMHPQLVEMLEAHPDCYFQVFTNGHFITDEMARTLRRLGNVTPLVSVEGTEIVSDERRGKANVLSNTMIGLENALKHKLLTGVCTSLCQTNFEDLLDEAWVDRLIDMGVMYMWYHVYRPIGPNATPELALTPAQQLEARKFVVEMRAKKPIIIIDAYYDGEGQALCPAATGFTHHISPWGDIEPCPIIQFATESIHDAKPLRETLNDSEFLRDFRQLAASATRGCIVLERPDLLKQLVEKHGARDTTVRGAAMAELEALESRPSQYNPGHEIPEKNWVYRFVKKHWFNDFGAYANFQAPQSPDDGNGSAAAELTSAAAKAD